jgi:ribonuclease VapC
MIAVDTSALMAILLKEAAAPAAMAALEADSDVLISAGTLAEALVVAVRRNIGEQLIKFVDRMGFEVVPVMHADALRVGQAYARWGKGLHPAALNYGDCFAYAIARERGCPLLYVGRDFAETDIASVL